MKTYAVAPGSTLTFGVDASPWETVTFRKKDFADPKAATADELAAVLNHSGSLASYSNSAGELVLATSLRGDAVSIDIDLPNSSAAAALGLTTRTSALGGGPSPARLVGQAQEPFALPDGAQMNLTVDRKSTSLEFTGFSAGASAADLAKAINQRVAGVARARRDGRILLASATAGPDSMLRIEPADAQGGKPDASALLGFTGTSAFSQPVRSQPAALVCSGKMPGMRLMNLTANPIQFHFPTGTTTLPAQGWIAMGPGDAGHAPLQRMIARGMVRIASGS